MVHGQWKEVVCMLDEGTSLSSSRSRVEVSEWRKSSYSRQEKRAFFRHLLSDTVNLKAFTFVLCVGEEIFQLEHVFCL